MTYLDNLADRIRGSLSADVGVPSGSDDLFRLYALLARAKGKAVTERDVHDAWVLWMQAQGERHPSMVPFEDLDPDVQQEDRPFVRAIQACA